MTCPVDPIVSIIINNFNYGRFLGAAVDSALCQTYPHVEVLIVDDGSTDQSHSILTSYAQRVAPILKANGGQASAVNAGFCRSRGDVVIFLDADDRLLCTTAARVADSYRGHIDVGKIQYALEVIDASGRPTGELKPPAPTQLPRGDLRAQILAGAFDIPWMPMSGNAYSRRVLEQILPIPENDYRPIGADWYLAHLSALFGPAVALDVGGQYRVHGANAFDRSMLDLAQIRSAVLFMRSTLVHIERTARRLALIDDLSMGSEVQSFGYVALRLISLRLDPTRHPIEGDSIWRLVQLGLPLVYRRRGSVVVKAELFLWLAAMVLAPRGVAEWLAKALVLPATRAKWVNLLLYFGLFGRLRNFRKR